MKMKFEKGAGLALQVMGHLAGVTIVAAGVVLLIMPAEHARGVASVIRDVPAVWDGSTISMALHFGLSACLWALLCIVFELVKLRVAERRSQTRATIRLSKGSVMTETLVIFPIFFLLTFGMAQLAVQNIAAILANVASYEAARAAWVWKPEADAGRLGVTSDNATEMCRIAVAMVMTPVAPGEFMQNPVLPDKAAKARMVALGANVPFMGVVAGLAGSEAQGMFQSGAALLSTNLAIASRRNQSVMRALDKSSFWQRTLYKFTHAFHASGCAIQADHSVKMTYQMQIAMPLMGRVFGKFKALGPGLRTGYYSEFKRDFGFRKQINTVNTKNPKNALINPQPSGGFDPTDYE